MIDVCQSEGEWCEVMEGVLHAVMSFVMAACFGRACGQAALTSCTDMMS